MAEILERGNIYFVYRPKVEQTSAAGLEDVQRLFVILGPHGKHLHRLIVIGRKRLPEIEDTHQRNWGFVQKIGRQPQDIEDELDRMTYDTATRGERHLAPARPAGEGVYALVRHNDHTHLAFALELPGQPGDVQKQLKIPSEGSYIITVKNPEQPAPRGVGLGDAKENELPQKLRKQFAGRRFAPVDPPALLDREGAELILIGADEDVFEELGVRLDPQHETIDTAEIFNDLRMERGEHPLEPLFQGKWR